MLRYAFITIIVFFSIIVFGQNVTSRLRIEAGGNVYFHFNSLEKYNNGIVYSDWTKLKVYFLDTLNNGTQNNSTKWQLSVNATRDGIYGDSGVNPALDLSTIEFTSVGTDAGATYNNPTVLSDLKTILVRDGSQTVDISAGTSGFADVLVSYHCGTTAGNKLLGKPPDYYYVDIVFTLEEQP